MICPAARFVGSLLLGVTTLACFSGCREQPADAGDAATTGLTAVKLQSDWYPQPEHGGYYQALAEGLFRDHGLDVEILPGGPGAFITQKVATGQVAFGMGRSDDVMLAVHQGLPLVIVCALMQHDPQALLLHEENPVNSFADLDGHAVMTTPGAAWIPYIKARHHIDFNILPLNFGLARFMSDKGFIQQAFITNEPFFVREHGGNPKTLLIADSGYDPYRVIFTNQRFARENPDAVSAFVAASIAGWDRFLHEDPSPATTLIAQRNSSMSDEFMAFSIATMKAHQLVAGDPAQGERIGLLNRRRLQEQVDLLVEVSVLPDALPLEAFVRFDFLPEELQPLVD